MPLTVACASPEMASGKVWIRYPVVRPQDQQQEDVQVQEFSTTAAEPSSRQWLPLSRLSLK
jgi:ribonuclease E